jgi:hypothetical protein
MRHTEQFTHREARAVLAEAEIHGFTRESGLIFWCYDARLHEDARRAVEHLRAIDGSPLEAALKAPDPVPGWVAAERITYHGVQQDKIDAVIAAAIKRGFEPTTADLPLLCHWDDMKLAIAYLWQHDPDVVDDIFGDHAVIAPLPASAITRCPSCCDDGWIPHPYAGEVSAEPDSSRWWSIGRF